MNADCCLESILIIQSARISETLSTGAAKRNSSRNDEANHEKEEFDNIFKEVQQLGELLIAH